MVKSLAVRMTVRAWLRILRNGQGDLRMSIAVGGRFKSEGWRSVGTLGLGRISSIGIPSSNFIIHDSVSAMT
jgi:hypothetical protein